jgi:predicted metal-dependent phosphoesterase TrpH
MFKTETHMHTDESSRCGKVPAREMVALYHAAGFKTLFISDHFQKSAFEKMGDELSWEEKIDQFLIGYREAKAAGDELGMNVILSAELRLQPLKNHYLLYGDITREFLAARPDIFEMGIEEFSAYAKEHGITVVQAHPLRDGKCVPTPEYVDGMEVFNPNPRHENFTPQVLEVARAHGLAITSGSDAHRYTDIAHGGVISEREIKTAADYVELLLAGELKYVSQVIDSRCGLHCSDCGYQEKCGCGGCIETGGKPFHGECPIAVCCQGKGLTHCGECSDFPCELLTQYSCDPEHGDQPAGARIDQCKAWKRDFVG